MAIIVTPQVTVKLLRYYRALLSNPKYKISPTRARAKYLRFWNYVTKQIILDIDKGHICMYRDMGQRFNKLNKPKFPSLKIVTYKDESQVKWYVAYVVDSVTGDITITKVQQASLIKCSNIHSGYLITEPILRDIIKESIKRILSSSHGEMVFP